MPRDRMPGRAVTPITAGQIPDRELQAVAARRSMETGLLSATLKGHFDKESARIDAEAAAGAVKATLEGELDLLKWGIAEANGSPAAAKLVADRIENLSRINGANLMRRFGS